MLKRKMTARLTEWKNSGKSNGGRKPAMLIKGARQAGKTFVVREFARANYKNFVEINFEKQSSARVAFKGDLDAQTIIRNLSTAKLGRFEPGETLIFFNEVQCCARARTAVKSLVEDGRFDYVMSGSLSGIGYMDVPSHQANFEEQAVMYPLDFEEFLWATGVSADIVDRLRDDYAAARPVEAFLHQRIMKAYREFLVVGGMPEAVGTFVENDNFSNTLKIQRGILDSYRNDLSSKKADKEKMLAKKMFDAIPRQLNKRNKRFVLTGIEKGTPARKYEKALTRLTETGIVYNCFKATALEAELRFNEKRNLYKLYMLDAGLLCALGKSGIQSALLRGDIETNGCGITENAVAVELAKKNIPLYYYDKRGRSEIDFVFEENGGLSAIEVKSGENHKTHALLDRACEETETPLRRRMVFSRHNTEVGANGVIYYPLYMTMFLG